MTVTFGPYEVGEYFLAAVLGTLDINGSDPITTSYVGIGIPAWDDCCGQLVVTPSRLFRSSQFPLEDTTPDPCDNATIAVEITVTLVRCIPTLDASGRPPKPADLALAHKRILDDSALVWASINAPLPDEYEWSRANVRQSPLTPSGGCVSVETTVTIGVEQSHWCI